MSMDGRASRVTVLVVEDEPDMRMLVELLLRRDARLTVEGAAASADEALALLTDIAPALIILDHGLEGSMTGLEAAPKLKAQAPLAKILLFTAFDLRREAESEPAIDGYLRKDKIGELLPTARRLLGFEELDG